MFQIKTKADTKTIFTILIALIWLINGLFCKILNLVPRHQEIVAMILNLHDAARATTLIGVLEVCMVVWILSRISPKFCAITQILVVAIMNVMEFFLVPELLLFGRMNIVFAAIFCGIIYLNEFVLYSRSKANN